MIKNLVIIVGITAICFSCKENKSPISEQVQETKIVTKPTAQPSMVLPSIPSIVVNNIEGKSLDLSSYKGKFLMIDFWAHWCGPCRNENPQLKKLVEEMKNKNIQFVSVSVDQEIDPWKKAVAEDELNWQQAIVEDENAASLIQKTFQIQGIPHGALISPEGNILVNEMRNADEVRAAINQYVTN